MVLVLAVLGITAKTWLGNWIMNNDFLYWWTVEKHIHVRCTSMWDVDDIMLVTVCIQQIGPKAKVQFNVSNNKHSAGSTVIPMVKFPLLVSKRRKRNRKEEVVFQGHELIGKLYFQYSWYWAFPLTPELWNIADSRGRKIEEYVFLTTDTWPAVSLEGFWPSTLLPDSHRLPWVSAVGEFQQSLAAQTQCTSAREQDWKSQTIDSALWVPSITWFGDIYQGLYFS